ncbi:unnamed protein product [Closterium sp. Yama58-4]|nr:unnamed protein product [Closterium sp. Yama58-4]
MHLYDRRRVISSSGTSYQSIPSRDQPTSLAPISASDVSEIFNSCTQLVNLDLRFGKGVSEIPASIHNCPRLSSLPEAIGRFAALQQLHLKFLDQLTALPHSLGFLTAMEELKVVECGNLVNLPESVSAMGALTTLILDGCVFSSLPGDIGQLQNLVTVELFSRYRSHLPDSFGQLGQLKELVLHECFDLFQLPASFTNLSSLETLLIYGAITLTRLPLGFEKLSKLRRLELLNCSVLYLPDRFGELPSLEILKVQTTKRNNSEEFELEGACFLRGFPSSFRITHTPRTADHSRFSDDLFGSILLLAASVTTTRFDGHDSDSSSEDILRDAISKALDEPLPSESAWVDTTFTRARVVTASSFVSFRHALVCKRWLRVARSVHPAIVVPYDRYFSSQTLGSLLASPTSGFPNLRHLHLGEFATDVVDRHLVRSVCDGCGSSVTHLTMHLYDRRLATRVQEDEIRSAARNGRAAISPSDVSQIFNSCTGLVDLDLRLADGVPTLPPSISRLQQLTRLSMRSTYSVTGLPTEFGCLLRLKRLEFELDSLEALPDSICDLTALEHLEIQRSPLAHLPENFGQLRNLRSLTLSLVDGLRELPESFCELPALTRFSLLYCYDFLKLPENFHHLSRLEAVEISTSTASFPDSFGQLPALQELRLQNWDFSQLPASLCSSQSLRSLTLNNCGSMTALPEDFGQISTLEYLNLEMFGDFKIIPDSIGLLSQLKELNVIDCCELSAFPQSVSAMESLTSIVLDACNLHELPGDTGQLSSLVSLKLSSNKLVTLPDSFGQLGKLKELVFMECNSLLELPNSFTNLNSLETLFICGGASLVDLPPGFETLPKLRTLYLFNCVFASLPDRFGDLPSLDLLRIGTKATYSPNRLDTGSESDYGPELEGACALQMLPRSLVRLTGLVELVLEGCELLEELPAGMGGMASLRVLQVKKCPQLRHFPSLLSTPNQTLTLQETLLLWTQYLPESLLSLGQLTHLNIYDLPSLQQLIDPPLVTHSPAHAQVTHNDHSETFDLDSDVPARLDLLASLQHLHIALLNLSALPETLDNLAQLRVLLLEECPAMASLPASLTNLSISSISHSTLPPSVTLLSSLIRLTIADCPNFTRLPDSISPLSTLASLTLTRLPFLRRLPSPLSLPRLITLSLQGCKRLRALPCDLGSLSYLREVDLDRCGQLKELPQSLVDRMNVITVKGSWGWHL